MSREEHPRAIYKLGHVQLEGECWDRWVLNSALLNISILYLHITNIVTLSHSLYSSRVAHECLNFLSKLRFWYSSSCKHFYTLNNFQPIFPANRLQNQDTIRSVIWVNKSIDTSRWISLDVPNTSDITAIQIKNLISTISIFNIYNDCNHSWNKTHLH